MYLWEGFLIPLMKSLYDTNTILVSDQNNNNNNNNDDDDDDDDVI